MDFSQIPWVNLFQSMGRIVVILVLTGLGLLVSRAMARRFSQLLGKKAPSAEQAKRITTLSGVIQSILLMVVFVIATLLVMSELGINLGPFLAAAGIGGIAVGFGAQSLVKDVISGFFLLLENQVRVGDVVVVGGTGGLVEDMGLRTITLRDLAGNVHIIPNGGIEKVTNMTRDYSRYVFDIGVAYREDPDEVMAIIHEVGESLRQDPAFAPDILEPLEMLGVDQFADSAVIIKCRVTTQPIKQWRVAREFNRRLKKAFDARGIEIPFPHRTIYWGEPKKDRPAPLHVVMDRAGGNGSAGRPEFAEGRRPS